jgi:hypothetical protein
VKLGFSVLGEGKTMKLNKKLIAVPAIALAASLSLAACGSQAASRTAPAVTHTVTAPAATPKPAHTGGAAPTTPAPKVIVVPAPVYAAPAPALTACGTGSQGEEVYANQDTSCPFALNVEQDYANGGYWYQTGTSQFYSYSPVTGQSYLMTSSSTGNPVVVTGGNNALVQFNY